MTVLLFEPRSSFDFQTQEIPSDAPAPAQRISPWDDITLSKAGFTRDALEKKRQQAKEFYGQFMEQANISAQGLVIQKMPVWGGKLIRRSGSVPKAVLEKINSNAFCKRRPPETKAYLRYIERCFDEGKPLQLRMVVGPVKNAQQHGAYQQPDLAEYFMFIQLARLVEAVASIYPYGVTVQMIPDDIRGRSANGWPESYSVRYIAGLQQMVRCLGFDGWLGIEDGQERVYDVYDVEKILPAAEKKVLDDPHFRSNFSKACEKAKVNYLSNGVGLPSMVTVRESAIRYMIYFEAEMLSGMWSPDEALPLMYAQHAGNYQMYTMGQGLTKLPWQVRLPFAGASDIRPTASFYQLSQFI